MPGLLLGVVVGGTSLVAALATLRSSRSGPLASTLVGGTLVGWIAGEVRCLRAPEARCWIEVGYAGVGLVMLALGLSRVVRDSPDGLRVELDEKPSYG